MDFRIRTFTLDDIEFAVRVTAKEKWGYSTEDFTLNILMGVGDHYIAEETASAKKVGMASTYNYGGKLAWIGNVVVLKEYRHIGVATLLLKHAVRHLRKEGVKTVRLYSYMNAEPLYEGLGFTREGIVGIFSKTPTRVGSVRRSERLVSQTGLLSGEEVDLEHLIDFDSVCFGSDRRKVISSMIRSEGVTCLVRVDGRNRRRIVGYIMSAQAENECEAGPWICDPERPDVAEDLLAEAKTRCKNKRITVAAPIENDASIAVLRKLGFIKTMEVLKMRKGRNLYNGKPRWIFAVGGLERG